MIEIEIVWITQSEVAVTYYDIPKEESTKEVVNYIICLN